MLRPEHPSARSLAGLAADFGLDHRGALDGIDITGITLRTTEVQPGDLFVGIHGAHEHGAAFADQAKERGAVALLTDEEGAQSRPTAACPS